MANLIKHTAESLIHWHGTEQARALVAQELAALDEAMEPPEDDEDEDAVKIESREEFQQALRDMVWHGQKLGFVRDFWAAVLAEIK